MTSWRFLRLNNPGITGRDRGSKKREKSKAEKNGAGRRVKNRGLVTSGLLKRFQRPKSPRKEGGQQHGRKSRYGPDTRKGEVLIHCRREATTLRGMY